MNKSLQDILNCFFISKFEPIGDRHDLPPVIYERTVFFVSVYILVPSRLRLRTAVFGSTKKIIRSKQGFQKSAKFLKLFFPQKICIYATTV